MSRNPEIIHNGSGYSIKSDEISIWQNIEFVMVTVANAFSSGQQVTLGQRVPEPPSQYGYERTHTQEKFARKCAIKSLNAFQRYLGYCAYAAAGAHSHAPLGDFARFYNDEWVSGIYKQFDLKDPDVHILAKFLLASLWKMRTSGNHTGVVVSFQEEYSYPTVQMMQGSKVPVYVAWPGPGVNPYVQFHQHHCLNDYIPGPELFQALENPHTPQPTAAAQHTQYGPPPAAHDSRTYDHPLDYVKMRLQHIPAQFDALPENSKRSAMDRLRSALKHSSSGGATFFRFESLTVIDNQTGQEKQCWFRDRLTLHEVREYFEDPEPSHLWHVHFVYFRFSLL